MSMDNSSVFAATLTQTKSCNIPQASKKDLPNLGSRKWSNYTGRPPSSSPRFPMQLGGEVRIELGRNGVTSMLDSCWKWCSQYWCNTNFVTPVAECFQPVARAWLATLSSNLGIVYDDMFALFQTSLKSLATQDYISLIFLSWSRVKEGPPQWCPRFHSPCQYFSWCPPSFSKLGRSGADIHPLLL